MTMNELFEQKYTKDERVILGGILLDEYRQAKEIIAESKKNIDENPEKENNFENKMIAHYKERMAAIDKLHKDLSGFYWDK